MRKIFGVGLGLMIACLVSFGQNKDLELLDRFNQCDSTMSPADVIQVMFQFKEVAKKNPNVGLLEEMQKLENDSLWVEMEMKCSGILKDNPVNLTASFYQAVANLELGKPENLTCFWTKNQLIYSAIKHTGRGSLSAPYIVPDINDAKALIYLYEAVETKIDSSSLEDNGLVNIHLTTSKGENKIVRFRLLHGVELRELYFDYHRDFEYYLAESTKPESQYCYETLLKKFQSQDQPLKKHEVIALMIGFTNNKHYRPYEDVELEREIKRLVGKKEYQKALDQSEKLLRTSPLDYTALMENGFCLMKLKSDKSYYPSRQSRMVTDAILWSGNGSFKAPYFVLSPIDGQTIIDYVLGGSIGIMGSGRDENGYFLDMLEMIEEGKEGRTLYFNIEHAIQHSEIHKEMERLLEKQKK